MCTTQMNTSDNPIELWDIQLSSWLFCELTRQLCPWLMASSCYFFALYMMYSRRVYIRLRLGWTARHIMHSENFLQASAGRLSVTNPRTNDHWQRSAGFPCTTCAYHNMHNRYCKPFTVRHSDSRWLLLQTSRAPTICFPHEETQTLGITYSITSWTQRWSPYTIPARTSPCNFSASC